MDKKTLEKLINISLDTGADFSEIFYEYTTRKTFILEDSKIDRVTTKIINGLGFRLAKDKEVVYASTSNLDYDNLEKTVNTLKQSFSGERQLPVVVLNDKYIKKVSNNFDNNYTLEEKKNILLRIDQIARGYSPKIEQVKAILTEEKQAMTIANHKGQYSKDKRTWFRLVIQIYVKDGKKRDYTYEAYGNSSGYNLFDQLDLEREVKRLVDIAIDKLDAIPCPSGDMPVASKA